MNVNYVGHEWESSLLFLKINGFLCNRPIQIGVLYSYLQFTVHSSGPLSSVIQFEQINIFKFSQGHQNSS
jgi:hypothetical protein